MSPTNFSKAVRDPSIYRAPGKTIDVSGDTAQLPPEWKLEQSGGLWLVRDHQSGKVISATGSRSGTLQQALDIAASRESIADQILEGKALHPDAEWQDSPPPPSRGTRSIEKALRELMITFKDRISSHVYLNQSGRGRPYIYLSALNSKKESPRGSGTAFMNALCDIADRYKMEVALTPGNQSGSKKFKNTTSLNRLRRFYGRFGFRKTSRDGRYDLSGAMYRRRAD